MSLKINPQEAASWSKEELEINRAYLTQRCNWSALKVIDEIVGAQSPAQAMDELTEAVLEGQPEEETVDEPVAEEAPKPRKAKSKSKK